MRRKTQTCPFWMQCEPSCELYFNILISYLCYVETDEFSCLTMKIYTPCYLLSGCFFLFLEVTYILTLRRRILYETLHRHRFRFPPIFLLTSSCDLAYILDSTIYLSAWSLSQRKRNGTTRSDTEKKNNLSNAKSQWTHQFCIIVIYKDSFVTRLQIQTSTSFRCWW